MRPWTCCKGAPSLPLQTLTLTTVLGYLVVHLPILISWRIRCSIFGLLFTTFTQGIKCTATCHFKEHYTNVKVSILTEVHALLGLMVQRLNGRKLAFIHSVYINYCETGRKCQNWIDRGLRQAWRVGASCLSYVLNSKDLRLKFFQNKFKSPFVKTDCTGKHVKFGFNNCIVCKHFYTEHSLMHTPHSCGNFLEKNFEYKKSLMDVHFSS